MGPAEAETIGQARPVAEVPRLRWLRAPRLLAASGGARVDTLSNRCARYQDHGPMVARIGGPFRFVDPFGTEASRTVLLARETTRNQKLDWRRLAKRLLRFAAVVVSLDLAIGFALAALLPRVHAGQQVGGINNAIEAEADLVILGSSHAMHSFDDQELTRLVGVRAHNAGLDGRGVLLARGLLALISQRHAPKYVVLDMTFADRDRTNAYAFAPYYGRSPIVDALLIEGDWRERVKLMSRSFRMNSVALAILANLFVDRRAWGFELATGRLDPSTPRDDHRERALAHPKPFVERNLVAFVEDARGRGAEVAFTESPTFGDARPADVRALYERVAKRLDVPILELSNEQLAGFGPDLFKDRSHLNRDGAARFTALIGARLRSEFRNGDSLKPLK